MKTKTTLLTGLLALTSGCSTLVNGTTQTIKPLNGCILSHPTKTLKTDSEGFYNVPRGKHTLTLKCGSNSRKIEPKPTGAGVAGAALLDFGIIDNLTGAFWGWEL